MIEELFKCPEKEIPVVLNDNIYKAKYCVPITDRDLKLKDIIFNIEYSRGDVFYDTIKYKNLRCSVRDFKYVYKPLSKQDFEEIKLDNMFESSEKWSYDIFFNFLANKFVKYYGEDRVDCIKNQNKIIIYYPEIIIRNSVELSHSMKDVYLTVYIDDDHICLSDIKRTTYSISEINNRYIFSHVNHYSFTTDHRNNSFCFGDNNPVQKMMYEVGRNRSSVLKNIGMFFPILDEYLSWESIEGAPYFYIEKVINDPNLFWSVSVPNYNKNELLSKVKENITEFSYSYVLNNSFYKVEFTQETIDNISKILTELYPNLSFINKYGQSLQYRNFERNISKYQGEKALRFKGEDKCINILESDPTKNNLPITIHTSILSDIVNTLIEEFETYLINKKYGEI